MCFHDLHTYSRYSDVANAPQKRESTLWSAPAAQIKDLEEYANAVVGNYFRALGLGKVDWQQALNDLELGDSTTARLLQATRNSRSTVQKLLPNQTVPGCVDLRTILGPTNTGFAFLGSMNAGRDAAIREAYKIAEQHLLKLCFNSHDDKRGRPCGHCGQYWVKKNKRQTVYCSKLCGSKHTALASNRKRRQNDRASLVEIAKASAAEWATTTRNGDWKEWVVCCHPEISKKFLTQACEKG